MIEILTSGAANTVQDLGRPGRLDQGVSHGGAMDAVALAAGNALLGNPADAAGIEIAMFPFRLRVERPGAVAVCGADCAAALDGQALPPCWAIHVAAGQTLSLQPPLCGARAYLAFAGGLDVPVVLGARATDLKSGFGGHAGRGLMRGDRLGCVAPAPPLPRLPDGGLGALPYGEAALPVAAGASVELRVVPGAEADLFEAASLSAFYTAEWTVTAEANRMGYRLAGPGLIRVRPIELFSHGILPGTVQVPPAGQPIIQLADANTCGGYPKIAGVIDADLWRLAQAPIGARLRFRAVGVGEAVEASREQARRLGQIAECAARLRSAGGDADDD